jgi:hypothetical protein
VDFCVSSTFEHAEEANGSKGFNGLNGSWEQLASISNFGSCATEKKRKEKVDVNEKKSK